MNIIGGGINDKLMDYIIMTVKMLVGIFILILIIRQLGRKQLSEMTPFDIVHLLVFGGLLDSTIYDDKVSIWTMIFVLFMWGLIVLLIEKITESSDTARDALMGTSDYILKDGKFNLDRLDRNKIEMEQLRVMLREKGVFSLKGVRDIILEPDGTPTVSMYEDDEEDPTFLLIDGGNVKMRMLKMIGKDEEWLEDQLSDKGLKVKNVLYCEWSESEGMFVKTFDDVTDDEELI